MNTYFVFSGGGNSCYPQGWQESQLVIPSRDLTATPASTPRFEIKQYGLSLLGGRKTRFSRLAAVGN